MSKLLLILLTGVMCALEGAYGNNYLYYPNSQGALNYQYQPFSPYVYSAYAAVPVDCDKSTTEGGEGASSESSSESTEGGESTEGSSSESSSEETKEGESSSSEEGGKKEEGSGEEKKEDSKKKVSKYVFPPVSYPYPPQTAQQVVYSAPSYPYMPYKAYSVIQQPASYSLKNNGYNSFPYYSYAGIPVSAGSYSAPVARIVSSPDSKVVSYPAVSKTITFGPASGVGGPAGYWNGNVGYYRV